MPMVSQSLTGQRWVKPGSGSGTSECISGHPGRFACGHVGSDPSIPCT
jgi:hypothetical protein